MYYLKCNVFFIVSFIALSGIVSLVWKLVLMRKKFNYEAGDITYKEFCENVELNVVCYEGYMKFLSFPVLTMSVFTLPYI